MNHPHPIKVMIADDHAVVIAGLRALIERLTDLTVVGEASTTDELVERTGALQPDVVVVDLRMPGGEIFGAIRNLKRMCPTTKTVVFTAYDDAADAAEAFRAGADGFVLKQAAGAEI